MAFDRENFVPYSMWFEPGGCQSCKHCAIELSDMDPTCYHPVVKEAGHSSGLHIDHAISGFCGGAGGQLVLFEERSK